MLLLYKILIKITSSLEIFQVNKSIDLFFIQVYTMPEYLKLRFGGRRIQM